MLLGSTPTAKPKQESSNKAKVLKFRLGYFEDYTSMPVVTGLEGSVRSVVPRRGGISETIEMLHAGELEIALVPAVEAMRTGNYQVIPASCCATLGASRIFMLFSNKLPTEIQTVLVDAQDYGITPTAKLLLNRKLMINPAFRRSSQPMAPGSFNFGEHGDVDAFLVTGRNNLFIRPDAFSFSLDLSQTWYEYCNLPLVMHCWVMRKGLSLPGTDKELLEVARRNERNGDVAEKSAEKWGVSASGVSAVYNKAYQTIYDPSMTQSLRKLGQDLNQARILPVRPISIHTRQSRVIGKA